MTPEDQSILDVFSTVPPLGPLRGPDDALRTLEEQHLVAVAPSQAVRQRFGRWLRTRLELNHRASVMDATAWLDAAMTEARGRGEDDGLAPALDQVAARLSDGTSEARHQYVLWPDMDRLIDADEGAVRRTLHVAFAAAAEREFVSPDLLQIQRHVMLGGKRLADFAAHAESPVRTWLEGPDAGAYPHAAAFCPSPRVATVPISR